MSRIMRSVLALILCSLFIFVPSIWASWIHDGVPLCTVSGSQVYPRITYDSAGGAIVTWRDERSGNWDIYAQRLNAAGTVQWTSDGVPLCTATGIQYDPTITSDGAGGAIVTWPDLRSGNYDIYAQRVDASGTVQWTADGVPLCTAAATQTNPIIISDGAGGAIVVWEDSRSGNRDIYAQRVNSAGAVQWAANGIALCAATGTQWYLEITSDGAGGAIVTWRDNRNGNDDIYAQRVTKTAGIPWTADGVAVCTQDSAQYSPVPASDGAMGAIITWEDWRSGERDIYAQRLNATGAVQWTADGIPLCTATGSQFELSIISDGTGGAIITWNDDRSVGTDIYTQRVDAAGTVQWTADGVPLCTATGFQYQYNPSIISDDAGGAIVTWYDVRGGDESDIYAQRVDASGNVQWTSDGVPLCTALDYQYGPTITSDGAGGAIVTWYDRRTWDNDIYAQLIDRYGHTGFLAPEIHAVRDVPGDQGGWVYLSWYAARNDIFMDSEMSHYSLWRAISPTMAAMALESGAAPLGDLSELNAVDSGRIIRLESSGGLTYFWELMETVDALYMETYGKPVATLFDSTEVCTEYHYFQVVAHTSDPTVFWTSEPDSGYSVDNIAPCPPMCLAGEQSFVPEGINLTWNRNEEIDLDGYRIYRGLTEDFVPGGGNIIASPCDTLYFDDEWRWDSFYYYKVSALDVHGNESGFALLRPENVTGDETPPVPEASYLSQNYPNPFNPVTRIEFGLAAQAQVSLRVYDASGRLVRVLVDEKREANVYSEVWDGTDGYGRAVASGVYFYRLVAGPFKETKKMVIIQ